MKLSKLLRFSLFSGIITLFACQKEFSFTEEFIVTSSNQPNITANVTGRITNENGKPVQGAEIRTGNTITFTDINGNFRLSNAALYDDAAFIKVKKAGYFTGSRTFVASQGQSHYVEVKLIPKTIAGTINGATGGSVALANGTSVTLPAAGVMNKITGAVYTGNVNVAMGWIDPTGENLFAEMPGDLRGRNTTNAERGLQSYGMVAVELIGDAGEPLQVASGKKAGLKFFLPASIALSAPASIPFWSFNDTTGLWMQEGFATKNGNAYEGEASHFSFWNCDAQFPVTSLKITLVDQNNVPLPHRYVKIRRTIANSSSSGYTDTLGVVKGKVPLNEPLILEVYTQYNVCNTVTYTQNIGPFSAASSITVVAPQGSVQQATISGLVVDCSNQPVAKGSVELIVSQRVYRAKVTNGAYSFSINVCSASQQGNLTAIDSSNSQQSSSSTLTITTGSNNAGTLTACGTSINQFINYVLGGTSYSFVPPADSVTAYMTTQGPATYISGMKTSGATTGLLQTDFSFNSITTGSGLVTSFTFFGPGVSAQMISPMTASITEYGNVGGFIAGTFAGAVLDSNVTKSIQCNFRVKRLQ